MMTTFNDLIESIESLSDDDQELLIDTIKKRKIDRRRQAIKKDILLGKKDYKDGKVNRGTAEDLMRELKS
jgi:hypothetical protein